MATSMNSTLIHAPADRVFDYLDDPMHQPEFWPSLVGISDVETLPNGGHRDHWTYKMAGIRLEGMSETTERVPNRRIVNKTTGGVDSTQTWTLEPMGDDTKVTFEVDYTVPVPVLGRLAEAAIVKLNDHEGEAIAGNLKTILEA